ncbi:MAG TPA: haloacid dehalogenase [Sulfurimonas sp. UBA12504]|nr:MAG: haloacid dehalogenase [Sulfurimonas sp. GWF2_37_8]DAB29956.1 MAG TPA: haloacid dehalogenase [Sulfurimonas sp. UBA12504]
MKYKNISIPNFKELRLSHVILDYNGTLAKDGLWKTQAKESLKKLSQEFIVHVITADTFGSVQTQLEEFDITIKVLNSNNHTQEKATYIQKLGAHSCLAIGNGNNDALMLQEAAISIALLGDEGCATKALMNSDIICKDITDALELLLNEKRLIATLRQ